MPFRHGVFLCLLLSLVELMRAHKCGFSKELLTVSELLVESGRVMFKILKRWSLLRIVFICYSLPTKNWTTTSEIVNPMFYHSVPPVPINVLLLTGACLIYNSFVFIVSIFYHVVMHFFFMHVCCVNSIKYEYEYEYNYCGALLGSWHRWFLSSQTQWLLSPPNLESKLGSSPFLKLPLPLLPPAAIKNIFKQNLPMSTCTMRVDVTTARIVSNKFVLHGIQRKQWSKWNIAAQNTKSVQ